MQSVIADLQSIYRYRYVVLSFVETNIRQRYRRSVLGFFWTVFAPLLQYLIIAVVFKYAARITYPGFFPYFFTGSIIFNAFSTTLNRAPMIMLANELYIQKIYLPKSIYVLSTCLYELTNFLFSAVTLGVLGVATGYIELTPSLLILPVAIVFIMMAMLGLSAILSVGGVYFRDLSYITPPIMQAMFFLTPILYQPDILPVQVQELMFLNPFYHLIEVIRVPITEGSLASSSHFLAALAFSVSSFLIGYWVLHHFDNRIVFKL